MVTHAPAFAIACHTRYGVHGVSMCLIPSTDGASMMALTPADSEPPDVHRRIAAGISKYELNAKGAGRGYRWTSRSVRYSRVRYSAFGKIERQKENKRFEASMAPASAGAPLLSRIHPTFHLSHRKLHRMACG